MMVCFTCPSSRRSSLAGCGGFALGWGAGASFCSRFTSNGEDMATVGGAGEGAAGGCGDCATWSSLHYKNLSNLHY